MMFPLVTFDLVTNEFADMLLKDWGHWLGGCNRPFGRQSFGLSIEGEVLAVAVSASTVNATCGGIPRQECVELARLCSAPPPSRSDARCTSALEEDRARHLEPQVLARAGLRVLLERHSAQGRHLPLRRLEEGRRRPWVARGRRLDTQEGHGAQGGLGL